MIFWDDRINKYVAYMRCNQHKPGYRGRSVARSESDHLGGFAEVQDAPIVLQPDSLDASLGGHPCVDYYTSGAIKYPWAQDAYYMFPQAYFHYIPKQLSRVPRPESRPTPARCTRSSPPAATASPGTASTGGRSSVWA